MCCACECVREQSAVAACAKAEEKDQKLAETGQLVQADIAFVVFLFGIQSSCMLRRASSEISMCGLHERVMLELLVVSSVPGKRAN